MKPLTHLERIKSVNNLAIKNNIPVKKVFDMYNKINDILYKNLDKNSLYDSNVENMTFAAIERYFSRLN